MVNDFDPYYQWLSIPPHERPITHYRLLAIQQFESNADVIAGAADRQMAHVRTFQSGPHSADSQKLLNELAAARRTLLDPQSRAAYDNDLRAIAPAAPVPNALATASRTAPAKTTASQPLVTAQALPVTSRSAVEDNELAGFGGDRPVAVRSRRAKQRTSRGVPLAPTLIIGAAIVGALIVIVITASGPRPQPSVATSDRNSADRGRGQPSGLDKTPRVGESSRASAPERPVSSQVVDRDDTAHNIDQRADDDEVAAAEPTPLAAKQLNAENLPPDAEPADEPSRESQPAPRLKPKPVDASRKRAIPDAAALKAARETIRSVLKGEFAEAKTPQSHLELAKRLMQQASESKDERPTQFALLVAARQEATKSGDSDLVLSAIQAIVADFDEVQSPLCAVALGETVKQKAAPADKLRLTANAIQQFDFAVAADDYDSAEKLFAVAKAASAKITDRPVKQAVANCAARLKLTHGAFDRIAGDFKTLSDDPENPAANLAVGRYLCLARRDWRIGLPHLARGDDAVLARLVQEELHGAIKPTEQATLASEWWDFSSTLPTADKDSVREHAANLYAKALPSLTGLPREQALHRLVEGRAELFLADLPYLDLKCGDPNMIHIELHINAVPFQHGVVLHVIENETVKATYAIDKRFRWLTGGVAINDQNDAAQPTPLTYRIVGDGRTLWESPPVQERGKIFPFDVNVSGVNRLELQINCPGWNGRGHSAFVDPKLSR